MLSVGVDLAAEAAGTAVATVDWADGRATLLDLVLGADDAVIIGAAARADTVGVDCPIGWPAPFVQFVSAHAAGLAVAPATSNRAWRRTMTLRHTDEVVHERTGLIPLSVSADRIGHAALRWAAIEAGLVATGIDAGRDGSGRVAEVYPAAALKIWGLPHRGYKRLAHHAERGGLVDLLMVRAPWLRLGTFEPLCRASDDALDAVICALVARAVALGATHAPDPTERDLARVEGWIHVPTTALAALPRQVGQPD